MLGTSPALGHEGEPTIDPGPDETVCDSTDRIEIDFGEAAADPRVTLTGPNGSPIDGDLRAASPNEAVLATGPLTELGTYRIQVFATSVDDHAVTSSTEFTVARACGGDTGPPVALAATAGIVAAALGGWALTRRRRRH